MTRGKVRLAILAAIVLAVSGVELAEAGKPVPEITSFSFDYVGQDGARCQYLARVGFNDFGGGQRIVRIKFTWNSGMVFYRYYGPLKGKDPVVEWVVDLQPGDYTIEEVALCILRKGPQDTLEPMMHVGCPPTN